MVRKLKPQRRDNSASRRGQQTVVAILEAARDILVEKGYPSLSMRQVATRVGMTVGNLSYYYPRREDLIRDLLEAVIDGYVVDWNRITDNQVRSPAEQLVDMIRFVIGDLATKETTGFFPALWALAGHDDFAEREMNKLYEKERSAFVKVIAAIRPDLGRKDHDVLALFITASVEGHTMFIGHQREKAAAGPAIANVAAYSLTSLVATIDAGTICEGLRIVPQNRPRRAVAR
jgi:AcrR family transcriptional regulator